MWKAIAIGVLALATSGAGSAATLASEGILNRFRPGLFFDLTASNHSISIESVDTFGISIGETKYEAWYRRGSFVGAAGPADGWELIGATVAPNSETTSTKPITIDFADITLSAGETIGFYLYAVDNPATFDRSVLAYTERDATAGNTATNSDLTISRGAGQIDKFSGRLIAPRDFVGNFHYSTEATAVAEPVTWAFTITGVGVVGAAVRRRREFVVTRASKTTRRSIPA